mgnify:CR=1 FL=1
MKKKVITIIPARRGSKGIESKNTVLLGNIPLIEYSIKAALECELLKDEDIIVTSDDRRIIEISSQLSDKLFLVNRPTELSTDDSSLVDVTEHAIQKYMEVRDKKPDFILLLQPTSPFRTSEDIISAIDQFNNSKLPSLLSVSDPLQHPSDFIFKKGKKWESCFNNSHTKEGRQNFTETWFINGAIYIVDFDYFVEYKKFYSLETCEVFHMNIQNSIDIDSPIDLLMANAWINRKN